jgi:preprotein translocase subunit SecE
MTKFTKFFREVLEELRKTSWPWDPKERGLKKYRELIDSTIVVFVAMVLLSAWINTWDIALSYCMRLINHILCS